MAHLITGYAGYAHIKSSDEGAFNASFFGGGQYVMDFGNCFEGSIIDNNTVRILDGDGLMYGRHFRIEPNTYEDLTIETGTAGTYRKDLICMTYKKHPNDETESAYLEVIKGIETTGTAVVPEYTDGNILEGATLNQMPLYEVEIDGVVLKSIKAVFNIIPSYEGLAKMYADKFEAACEELKASFSLENVLKKTDVVDNLTSTATDLPLSANQGKELKALVDAKQASINLTASRALVSDASGKVAVSGVTSTELGYLDGVTSKIQTQLNGKAASSHGNHVPTVQTANNAKFLRNDNSWQTVTPANIGAVSLSGGTSQKMTAALNMNGKEVYRTNTVSFGNASTRFGHISESANQNMYIASSQETAYELFLGVMDSGWSLCPSTSGNLQLGTGNHKWGQIYSTASSISTSDRNVKKNIQALTEQHLKFFRMLQPVSFAFIDGTSGRTHVGFISQDVEEAMIACGLSDLDFAGFCKDQKMNRIEHVEQVEVEEFDSEGNTETVIEERITYEDVPVEGEFIYSLRYEEFIGLVTQATQEALNKIDALEAWKEEVEKRLLALEA